MTRVSRAEPVRLRPVEAVIFDWGGTLTPWHEVDLAEQWKVFARKVHADSEAVEALATRILEAEDRAWARAREQHESARLLEILADAGHDADGVEHAAALAAYEGFWDPHTLTDEQVGPLWEGLRAKGIRVGVLSNTIWSRDFHRAVFERDGVAHLIDADIYSSEVPWAKPHPEIFHAAASALEVEPAACVYVGDRIYEDVHGAQSAGMRGVLVPHSDIPAVQRVAVDAEPDGVIAELRDLLPMVDGWTRP